MGEDSALWPAEIGNDSVGWIPRTKTLVGGGPF